MPIDIGNRLELFVDRELIESLLDTDFRLHEPVKQPLARAPLPEGGYTTIIRDADRYRAYYRDEIPGYDGARNSGHSGEITCYAESRDGMDWVCPELNVLPVKGNSGANVILYAQPFCHNFSPFLDNRSGVEPEARYKALAGHPGFDKNNLDGLHTFVSANGIEWRKSSVAPVIPYQSGWSHAFDSQNVAFWSEAEGLYVAYFRTWTPETGKAKASGPFERAEYGWGLRSIARATSPDFIHWSSPEEMHPNLPGEHLYTSQTHPYFRAPHIYVALPSRYVAGRVGSEEKDPMLGSTDILFMTSRAGTTCYERLFTEAFIRPGLDPERWRSRGNYVALNVVPTSPTEMSIYHCQSGHRYALRTDGFVSVRAGAGYGELLTKPLTFKGNALLVNFSTSAAGSLRVELQDNAGRAIPGFEMTDCPVIVGDSIERRVAWKKGSELGALAGQAIRLRFAMQECDLFSLRFS